MNNKSLMNYYVWGIKLLVFIIPFLSLWIASSMYFPYISGRNFAFRILVEIALVLWVALMIVDKRYRPRLTPIVTAVLVFAAIIGIADFLGIDPYSSFWSRLERMEGWLTILHLTAYFLILTGVFRTKKDWFVFLNLFAVAGVLVGGYGVLQLLGIKEAIQGGDVRIDGTIGNPTYLAAYLTLVIALVFVLLFNAGKRWQKYLYGMIIAFLLFVMFFTASRGAALAWLVSLPPALILYLIFFRGVNGAEKKFKRIAIGILIAMVALPTILWGLKGSSLIQNSETLSRLTSVSFGERTIRARFYIWGMAWKAFLERPILGWGQENFLIAFSKYYDPRLYDQEPWFDRPHNIVFEWLINAGIIGLLSYLALFAAFFWTLGKLLKRGAINKKEGIILWIAPIVYFLQNFFVFDNFNTYVIFFGLLAYANSLYAEFAVAPVINHNEAYKKSLAVLAIGGVIMAAAIYFVNIKAIAQARGIIGGLRATTVTDGNAVQLTFDAFKKTVSYNSLGTGEALEQLVRVANLLIGQSQIPTDAKMPFLQYTVQRLERHLARFPLSIRLHLMLAGLYQSMRGLNPDFIFLAREEIKTALSLSPTKQQILFLLADNYFITNEADKAVELLEKAAALEPTNRDAQINLAIAGIFVGRSDLTANAIADLNEIRVKTVDKRNPPGPLWAYVTDLNKIAEAYLRAGQREMAREIYWQIKAVEQIFLAFKDENVMNTYRELLQGLEDDIKE